MNTVDDIDGPVWRDVDHVQRVAGALGYDADPDYVTDPRDERVQRHRHALAVAFEHMGVAGALCLTSRLAGGATASVPVVYLASCADAAEADRVHRAIWSQSLAPLVILLTPDGFQVRNGFNYTAERGPLFPWNEWPIDGVHPALAGLRSESLRTSLSWQHFATARMSRVDDRLYRSIKALNANVRQSTPDLADRADLVNALIGRVLYLLVLIDRGIVTQADVTQVVDRKGRPLCADLQLDGDGAARPAPWPAAQFWALLDAIDDDLNGTIFPIPRADRGLLDDGAINMVRDVLRRDAIAVDGVQYGFVGVDYGALRTETISAIYEQFFAVEDEKRKATEGAFYTPAYLVDYVLDELDGISPLTEASVVCDPAAGSGAFLVAAYRRAVERTARTGQDIDAARLKRILIDVVHGLERNEQAANVARFSLYLTMLDYLPGVTWGALRATRQPNGEKLFPDMRRNLLTADFFARLPVGLRGKVTHVIGNPPWTRIVPGEAADAYRKRLPPTAALAYGNLAELFAWRALLQLAAPGGAVALVMAARSFIGSKVGADASFPTSFASATRLHGITNLSHFRRKLFEKAGEAAVVIFATNEAAGPLDWTWRYSPLLTSQPLDKNGTPWGILVDRGVVERSRQVDLLRTDREWFQNLMLQPLDRVFAERVAAAADEMSLGAFLRRHGIHANRGGYEPETGMPAKYHLGTGKGLNHYRTRLGLDPGTVRSYNLPIDLVRKARSPFSRMFAGDVLLVPRAHNFYDVVDTPVAFNSSLVGLYFASDELPAETRLRILEEIAAYMRSNATRYLMAVVGKAWILEQRRFEVTDMLRLPFPYQTIDELLGNPPSTTADDELTALVAERCRLGPTFAPVVEEHHRVREGYQNGKVPSAARSPVGDAQRTEYERMLGRSLASMFGGTATIEVDRLADAWGEALDTLVTLRRPGSDRTAAAPTIGLPELAATTTAAIGGDADVTIVRLSKPPALSAWTLDRAYADAMGIVRDVLAQ